MKSLKPVSKINSSVRIPGSKSVTHRALIAASLAEGESILDDILECDDTIYTTEGLRQLGVSITLEKGSAKVHGAGGVFPGKGEQDIFLGNSGTSFRLLLSITALANGVFSLKGTERMEERPIKDLVDALRSLGVDAGYPKVKGYPPVRVNANGILGGKVSIPGTKSSQYISSLLLAAPYAESNVEIEVTGELVSQPYIDLTIDIMRQFGVDVENNGYCSFKVSSGQRYEAHKYQVEGDVSNASYFWAAAAVTGGRVATENIYPGKTRQGDIRLLNIFEKMGCVVDRQDDCVVVQGGDLKGVEVDMSAMPDMVPTLAAVATYAKGRTVISNVPHLRIKESDRIASVAQEWGKLGVEVEELPDGMIINGGREMRGAVVDPHDDHRLAMSLAVIGLKTPGIQVKDEHCVAKSFPRFWEVWDSLD